MKHTKFEWMPLYSYLDRTAITAHLSDMAAQGWMLEKIGGSRANTVDLLEPELIIRSTCARKPS